MRWALRRLGVTALLASGTHFASGGRASAQPEAPLPEIALYEAPATCPPRAEFARRLRGRLGPAQGPGQPPRVLQVRIETGRDGRYVGTVSLTPAGGRSTAKALSGNDCDGLVDALALVSALALRSDAEPTDSAPPEPPAPPAPARPAAPPPAPPAGPPAPAAPASRWAVEVGALVASGPAPSAILSGVVGVGWSGRRAGVLDPAVALDLAAGASPDLAETGGTASFAWFDARADLCALGVALGPGAEVRGCLLGDAGVLRASGSNTAAPASSSRGWLSLGASARLEVAVGDRFGIHLAAAVEAPLRRDRYAFGSSDFFEVPAVVVAGSATLAAYFR